MKFSQTLIVRRVSSSEKGAFTGLASTTARDRHGDIIARGAFSSSITALKAGTRRVPLLQNHDTSNQIGAISDADETDDGLVVHGRLVLGTAAADRAHKLMLADALGLSVGFLPLDDPADDADGGHVYHAVDLVEISAVSTPSNRESRVLTVKSLAESSPVDLERMLRDGDLPELPRRLAAKLARAFHAALDANDDDDPSELLAALDRLRQIHTRK